MIFKPIVVFLQPSDTVSLFLFVCFYEMLNTSYYPICLSRFCSFPMLFERRYRVPIITSKYLPTRMEIRNSVKVVMRYPARMCSGRLEMCRILVDKGLHAPAPAANFVQV